MAPLRFPTDCLCTNCDDAQAPVDVSAADPEEAAPGTDTPTSLDINAPQAPGNELTESASTAAETFLADACYWQPGPYHAPPVYASGWYYQDIQGQTQGPFTKQQLQLWRQHLPMDLRVWFIDHNGGSSHSLELAKVLGDGRLLESWRKSQHTEVWVQASNTDIVVSANSVLAANSIKHLSPHLHHIVVAEHGLLVAGCATQNWVTMLQAYINHPCNL